MTDAVCAEAATAAADLAEAIAVLRMPRAGLRRWIEGNKAFCERHGGRRYYAELMDLYDDCLAALAAPEA